jgi:DNA invertase Pin-like site-specific DNA recombinase
LTPPKNSGAKGIGNSAVESNDRTIMPPMLRISWISNRLARNVHFISGLMESKVDFIAVDMPSANRLTVHIMAAFAEHEREMISQRTKAALAQAKHRGTVLGNPRIAEARQKAIASNRTPPPSETIDFIWKMKHAGETLRAIASQLNALNIRTGRGSLWYANTIRQVLLQPVAVKAAAA